MKHPSRVLERLARALNHRRSLRVADSPGGQNIPVNNWAQRGGHKNFQYHSPCDHQKAQEVPIRANTRVFPILRLA
jgi:hypothetical protein